MTPPPVTGVVTGDEVVIEIEDPATPATFLPVNDLNRFSRRTTRSTTRTRVFMRANPYVNRGAREFTVTISGFLSIGDPGQDALRAAMNTDVPVKLKVMPDGVNGFTQDFYVGNQGADASPDPTALQEVSWELAEAAAPVAVGTGPIL
jgi:hypothetical protein